MLFSVDLPQANSVSRLFDVVHLVGKGRWRYIHLKHELGITHRQGLYYKTATEILGLTDREYLTEKGENLVDLSEFQKKIFMKDLILNSKAIKAYLSIKSEDKEETFLEFKKLISPDELSDATIKRRISTLERWLEYCNSVSSNELSYFSNSELTPETVDKDKIILIEKDEHKTEEARINHENLVQLMKKHLYRDDCEVYEDRLVDLIYNDNKNMIFFEMKSITEENKGNQLKKALGQLIFYRNFYKTNNVVMVVVVDKYFKHIDILEDDPIHVIWREGDSFNSDKKTRKRLKIIFDRYENG
tara:strand:+ start:4484 stop:5389 length:906 start_codon:yes stop_codon:yes gene_type:complete